MSMKRNTMNKAEHQKEEERSHSKTELQEITHRLKQQEMILEQERGNKLRLEELQKLQLAPEQELILHLKDQKREQEAINAAANEYMYQNTSMGRGVKGKPPEQLNHGQYIKKHAKKLRRRRGSWVHSLLSKHPY